MAVWRLRPVGGLVTLVDIQLSVPGVYRLPVFHQCEFPSKKNPPQTIISLPVQIAVCSSRPVGALVMFVGVQVSVVGLYRPPVFNSLLPL
jgi:hypothetical protein